MMKVVDYRMLSWFKIVFLVYFSCRRVIKEVGDNGTWPYFTFLLVKWKNMINMWIDMNERR